MANTIKRIQSVNNVVLSGVIGSDDNIWRNEKGNMATFQLAHYCGKSEDGTEKTAWLKVKVFNTEKCPNDLSIISKGQKVVVEGRLDVENFTRKSDGSAGSKVILVANTIRLNVPVEYQAVEAQEEDLPAKEF